MLKNEILVEKDLKQPISRVWEALTCREAMSSWLMSNDFELKKGQQFTLETKPGPGFDGIVSCKLLDFKENEFVSYTWKGGPIDTIVTFRLVEVSIHETKLLLEHTGFSGVSGHFIKYLLKMGWNNILGKKLVEYLEKPRYEKLTKNKLAKEI